MAASPASVTKLRWGDIGRSGSSELPFSSSLTKARLIVGYRCCTDLCLDLRASLSPGWGPGRIQLREYLRSGGRLRSKIRFVAGRDCGRGARDLIASAVNVGHWLGEWRANRRCRRGSNYALSKAHWRQ